MSVWRSRALVTVVALLLAADLPDPRGWQRGTVAADLARVTQGNLTAPVDIRLPASLAVTKPTVIVYFSPTCPHCRHVAPEIVALAERIAGKAEVVWVASGRALQPDLAEFQRTFGVKGRVIRDEDAEIVAAIGARSTPSVLYVVPSAGKLQIRDAWYPYSPGHDFLVEGRVTGDVWKAFRPGEYQGDNACGSCHSVEMESWKLTHHSVAWWSLVEDHKQDDAACNRCHVVGAGQKGGFDGNVDSPLVNVGCEACHGAGGPHDGTREDAKESCAGCHDAEHSIDFSVGKGMPFIDHFAATDLDRKAIDERHRKLASGEMPRPLLAFPVGENVGAAACQACHPTEHASWSLSPHSAAMGRLATEGADDPGCVRCHATPKATGPVPKEIAGFRLAESVSCESCHGPGAAHVAAGGGKDNIEGLGEDCPVCVIEAVCTTCHTKTWDPDWVLEPSLRATRHRAEP